jgi:hypothetical protein
MMPVMPYQHDEQARQDADAYRISNEDGEQLRILCMEKIRALGDGGLRGHPAHFRATAWHDLPGLPDPILSRGRNTRGDVLDIGERVRAEGLSHVVLLAASFAWGTGMTGYGPRRYREIVDAAGARLELSLYGGYEPDHRARPGQDPWSRLHKLGPAFFTKFLYFGVPGALILDNRVACAVHERSRLPHLVTADRRSIAWTPYRYAVYLHWMRQTAQTAGVRPETVELTLFQPPADPMAQEEADE